MKIKWLNCCSINVGSLDTLHVILICLVCCDNRRYLSFEPNVSIKVLWRKLFLNKLHPLVKCFSYKRFHGNLCCTELVMALCIPFLIHWRTWKYLFSTHTQVDSIQFRLPIHLNEHVKRCSRKFHLYYKIDCLMISENASNSELLSQKIL